MKIRSAPIQFPGDVENLFFPLRFFNFLELINLDKYKCGTMKMNSERSTGAIFENISPLPENID